MRKVKRYSVWADELFGEKLAINSKNGMAHLVVKFDDYAALESKCSALAAEVQAVRWACGQVYMKGYNHGHLNTVDGLEYASDTELVERGGEALADLIDPDHCGVATNAILAEIERKAIRNFISSIEHILRDKLSPYGADEMLESRRIFLKEQGGAKK